MNACPVVEPATTCARSGLARDTLRRFGTLRMRPSGGSMLPAIVPGDLLTFRACQPQAAVPGQVVLVRCSQRLVAHRVVARHPDGLLTRGDALAAADPPVPHADVLGVLVGQQRGKKILHAGGRYWLRRQRVARWLVQRSSVAHRLLTRLPLLATLAA